MSSSHDASRTPAQQNKLARDKEYQRQKRANKAGRRNASVTPSDDESVASASISTRRSLKRKAGEDD
jgi:chromatin modification-related protein EAF6